MPCGVGLNVVAHVPPLWQKIEHIDHTFLYALTLLLYYILIDMIDYANCITLVSSSFSSSIDKDGT